MSKNEVIANIIESLRNTTKAYQDSDEKVLSEMSLLDVKVSKLLNSLFSISEDTFTKGIDEMQNILSKSDDLTSKMSSETARLGKERDAVFESIKIEHVESRFSKEIYELMLTSQKRRNTELTIADQGLKLKQIQEEIEILQKVEASYSKLIADTLRDDRRARITIDACQHLLQGLAYRKPNKKHVDNIEKLIMNCEKGNSVLRIQKQIIDKEIKNLIGAELKYTDKCRNAMVQELQSHSKALLQDSDSIEKLLLEMKRVKKFGSANLKQARIPPKMK